MTKSIKYVLTFFLVFLFSCNLEPRIYDDQAADIPETFRQDLGAVLDQYFVLKNALVASDPKTAAESADLIAEFSEKADVRNLDPEKMSTWFGMHEKITAHSLGLASKEDIEKQRADFRVVSQAMIDMVNKFHPAEYDMYHQQCLMFGDEMADWLSRHEEIQNPYHGESMMDCGNVKEGMSHDHGNGHYSHEGVHHH